MYGDCVVDGDLSNLSETKMINLLNIYLGNLSRHTWGLWKKTTHCQHFPPKLKVFIESSNFKTKCFVTKTGLPQGSVISSLLFIIYINDLLATHTNSFNFADNTSVLVTGKNFEELQVRFNSACREIEPWCRKWRMVVNGSKTS